MVARYSPPPHKSVNNKHEKKRPYSYMPGEEKASQGQGLRWRALLGQVSMRGGAQNAFTGDSMACLSSKSSMMMGMATGAAHR